jgi:hypothetical protein
MRKIQSELCIEEELAREHKHSGETYINSKTNSVNNDMEIKIERDSEDACGDEDEQPYITPEDINKLLSLKEPNTEEAFIDNNLHFFNFDDYFTV